MSIDPTTQDQRRPADGSPIAPSWRNRLVRRTDDRVIAGVAAGLAANLGIDPVYTRAGFVVLSFAGGVGLVLYGLGWVLFPSDVDVAPQPAAPPATRRQVAGMVMLFVALLIALRSVGLWFGDAVVWPVLFVAFGGAAALDRRSYDYRSALGRITGSRPGERPSRSRVIVGGVMMFLGIVMVLRETDAFRGLGTAAFAVAVTVIGFVLVFGPWAWGMANDLATERRDRIRADERAEVAAHLHDSVLQTLALIQRTDDPKRMITLARAQERELRSWLYRVEPSKTGGTLRSRLEEVAADVEQDHDTPIDVVMVGNAPLDDRTAAIVAAATEAMKNAARHSAAQKVSVYVEASPDSVDVWVSDQGVGFDPGGVDEERLGIKESIVGRMARHRGTATIISEPGEGAEVHLHMEDLAR